MWESFVPGLCIPSIQATTSWLLALAVFLSFSNSLSIAMVYAPQGATASAKSYTEDQTSAFARTKDLDHSISVYQKSGHVLLKNQLA